MRFTVLVDCTDTSVQDDGDSCKSTLKDELPLAKRVFSKQYTFTYYRASQSRVSTRRSPFTTCVKRMVISVYLNSMCYLILYTRLFTKLNLFKILLYVTFLTTKFSRSTVYNTIIFPYNEFMVNS